MLNCVALRPVFFISVPGTRVNFTLLKVAGFWHVMACSVLDVPTFRGGFSDICLIAEVVSFCESGENL